MTARLADGVSRSEKVFPKLLPQAEYEGSRPYSKLRNFLSSSPARVTPRAVSEEIRAVGLSVQNLSHHGDLFTAYLKARRQIFIVGKGWRLPEVDGMEFDQYDTPRARWIAVHKHGEVLAGIRLAPTESRCGVYSYMLRDAQLGLLEDIPPEVLFDAAPVSKLIWEATRLFIMPQVPACDRSKVQRILMASMAKVAVDVGATQVIGIVPAVFKRWLTRIGMDAESMGPVMKFDGVRSQAALMDARKYRLQEIISPVTH